MHLEDNKHKNKETPGGGSDGIQIQYSTNEHSQQEGCGIHFPGV